MGSEAIASPEEAAFVNGGLGNILEMDDVHRAAILHPGPVVIPAALAAAESAGASGETLLDAIAKGYEADIRLGVSLGPGHYAKWHNTATCGPFGAAAAVGHVLGLDESAIVSALGNAATQSTGPWRCRHEQVMTKQLHTARAAQAGFAAASLAASGFTGPEFMLEGEQGFYDAMCPDPEPDRLLAEPDGPWKVWETSFKPWPACRHTHPAIDAALLLRERSDPAEIRRVEIETFGDARTFCDRPSPETPLEAKFSLQHAVALTLLDGPPALDGFSDRAIARDDLRALREKTEVRVSEPFASQYPDHFGASVSVTLASGQSVSAEVADALGDPENPLSAEQIVSKARVLMAAGGASEELAGQTIDAALALPSAPTLGPLSSCLQALAPDIARRTAA